MVRPAYFGLQMEGCEAKDLFPLLSLSAVSLEVTEAIRFPKRVGNPKRCDVGN